MPEKDEIYKYYNKRLPHWRKKGGIYLVTVSTDGHLLNNSERKITFDAILYWHNVKYIVICVSVMPDHAHLICSFGKEEKNEDLSKIIQSIKAHAARKINRIRGTNGRFWQREFFNRVLRGEQELNEKVNYIYKNAKAGGLTEDPEDYPFWWFNEDFLKILPIIEGSGELYSPVKNRPMFLLAAAYIIRCYPQNRINGKKYAQT